MSDIRLTGQQIQSFNSDGYLFVEGLFDRDEVDLLQRVARSDQSIKGASSMADASGGQSKIWITSELKQDVYSAFSHCARVVSPLEQLLDDEVYFYHHKMMLKEPRTGGAWEWHQDYGYWYNDGFLFPDMASCMVAVDKASKSNGCLQVLRASHRMGRIGHGTVGKQVGADLDRVEEAMKRFELVYCEMEPGTALFFHSNLLHCSDQNRSENSRWSFISCYTAARNVSFKVDKIAWVRCAKIDKWPDEKIKELGGRQLDAQASAS